MAVCSRPVCQGISGRAAGSVGDQQQSAYLSLKSLRSSGNFPGALLDSVYVHPSNVVRMVASLEKKGFLTRTPCEQDKRTWQLYPTQRALDISGQIRAACEETESVLLHGLTAQAQADFQATLSQVGRKMAREQGIVRTGDEFDD